MKFLIVSALVLSFASAGFAAAPGEYDSLVGLDVGTEIELQVNGEIPARYYDLFIAGDGDTRCTLSLGRSNTRRVIQGKLKIKTYFFPDLKADHISGYLASLPVRAELDGRNLMTSTYLNCTSSEKITFGKFSEMIRIAGGTLLFTK